ncbi:HNH endonuclease [Anaerosoma tenue]|uniref:HNH endonuclease n=1 Tax=Anaerosoma tenue TaxID=2933588 RepID=UPI002260DE60|nr:HNH endonuclease [Anaerosoma tenue]MCK8114801.1 HNH endonuclease [Anaerosoma tenue]
MRGFIGNTDYDWYRFLAAQPDIDEVNFWQPSGGGGRFGVVSPGEPFFFRLKSPHNAIAGFGYFASYSALPAWLAWESFGRTNGAADFDEMRARIERYRRRSGATDPGRPGDYAIGCIMVASPVFFPQELWVREPADWAPNIVRGRGEDLTRGEGLRIFTECLERAQQLGVPTLLAEPDRPRYGEPTLVKPRLGQGIFRVSVLDAYDRACAVTGEHSLPVLEAAHIMPYADGGTHDVTNGLLLRSDIHRLFDLGYVTVTPEYRFKVSDALAEDFHNGRTYYAERDRRVVVPDAEWMQPSRELLAWHGESVWRG